VASQPNSEQGISDRQYAGVNGQLLLEFAPLGIAFQPRLPTRRRIAFNGLLGPGYIHRWFFRKSVEPNSFCPVVCKDQVEKRSMGSMRGPQGADVTGVFNARIYGLSHPAGVQLGLRCNGRSFLMPAIVPWS